MSKRITWLHLSDLHMTEVLVESDRTIVLTSLLKDIKSYTEKKLRPDFIFFSGDLAFGQLPKENINHQLDLGFKFLDEVRSLWTPEIPKENIFLVPGNHDVRRDLATQAITHFLNSTKDLHAMTTIMAENGLQWEQIVGRMKPYKEALERHGYSHLLEHPHSLIYRCERNTASGVAVDISGLNTAWSCVGDRERGHLWFCGKWQLKMVRPKQHLSIGLMHHPVNWLREEEEPTRLERLLASTFTFLLHGHEHDEWITATDKHVRIAAGACYGGEDQENGYNFASIDPMNGEYSIHLRKYDRRGMKWVADAGPDSVDADGIHHGSVALTEESQTISSPSGTSESTAVPKPNANIFLAAPMASLTAPQYQKQREQMKKVLKAVRALNSDLEVYYPAGQIPSPWNFDPPEMAIKRGLRAIEKSRLFVMIFTDPRPSSILVEAGFALAKRIPSIYFVKVPYKLPFLLDAATKSQPNVKAYEYISFGDIAKILQQYREEFSLMTSAPNKH